MQAALCRAEPLFPHTGDEAGESGASVLRQELVEELDRVIGEVIGEVSDDETYDYYLQGRLHFDD